MNGMINFLKPPGMSSAQAVSFVKWLIKEKIGHAGTLDPEAAGVLPLMVGRATKLFDYVTEDFKIYLAEIAFGCATDTQDAQGRVICRGQGPIPDADRVREELERMTGTLLQRPPMFSALKRNGERLYDLARKGQTVEMDARPVTIYRAELAGINGGDGYFIRVHCGKGTYIRTICHDLGERLGYPAHMRFLLREQAGAFKIDEAVTPEELKHLVAERPDGEGWLHAPDRFLSHLPRLDAGEEMAKMITNGVAVDIGAVPGAENVPEGSPARVYICGRLVCISVPERGRLRMRTMYNA